MEGRGLGRRDGRRLAMLRAQNRTRHPVPVACLRIGAAEQPPRSPDRARPPARARCGKAARRDLCGGQGEIPVPTATAAKESIGRRLRILPAGQEDERAIVHRQIFAAKVGEAVRGTFAGLAAAPVVKYLHDLGITAVELLPIHAFIQDRHLAERGLRNYWGYNTLGFFAPHPEYLGAEGIGEFKAFVQQMHDAGIEVILDVVYNHTAEGNQLGPTLSFRGIDNRSYYSLMPGAERYYRDFTGTGNALEPRHPYVLRMVMDSLRYWGQEMGVDGFRFDLATTEQSFHRHVHDDFRHLLAGRQVDDMGDPAHHAIHAAAIGDASSDNLHSIGLRDRPVVTKRADAGLIVFGETAVLGMDCESRSASG